MKLRLHPLYKNLLLLAMVLGPLYWLILTEDGQIRTDVVLLTLFGKPELNLTIERLNSDLTEAQLRALFPDLTLDCEAAETPFGDRACRVEIGIFNSVPARAFTLFLEDDQVRAARVDYRPRSQGARLTAWELMQDGIPVTLIADNAAGLFLRRLSPARLSG